MSHYLPRQSGPMQSRGNERGIALVAVLIMVVVLGVLGTALMQYALMEISHTSAVQESTQAYYIARSGADALASYIISNPDNLSNEQWVELLDDLVDAGPSSPTVLGNGTFVLTVNREDADTLVIHSTGTVGGTSRTASVTIVTASSLSSGPPALDMAVFAHGKITLTGSARLAGDVATNSTAQHDVDLGWSTQIQGNLFLGPGGNKSTVVKTPRTPEAHLPSGKSVSNLPSARVYPLPDFPDFPTTLPTRPNMVAGWWPAGPHEITQDGSYSLIDVANLLTINVGSGERHIRVNTFKVHGRGSVNIVGTGRLILYVSNFQLEGYGRVNEGGQASKVHMYYSGSTTLNLGGDTRFVGSVHAQSANVVITGSGGITGNIITGGTSVEVTGDSRANVRALYAPNAHVKVLGSGQVKGPVVSNRFTAEGGSRNAVEFADPSAPLFDDWVGDPVITYAKGVWR